VKLRILPITITAALTAAILFGGWFAYRYYGLEQPLDKITNAIPGVEAAEIVMTTSVVKVMVQLAPDANLSEVYRLVEHDGANEIGNKQLEFAAVSKDSPRLEEGWSYALFDVAEAMENRKYSAVRETMDSLTEKFPGISVKTNMDDKNVYISMQDGVYAKFIVLPRQPATLGVWSNA
jgi:hypothetical protein